MQEETTNYEFKFNESVEFKERKETTKSGQYKYAISQWEIKQGKYAVQVNEYGFNGTPE